MNNKSKCWSLSRNGALPFNTNGVTEYIKLYIKMGSAIVGAIYLRAIILKFNRIILMQIAKELKFRYIK